ncbi:hypothetical protein HD806DRAFT_547375 [Xylariaceae sp. AK1471]|nr:hypothetical protein HD806DRAFT_547375 [Xylariaceae sp. AK1471]
MDIPPSDQSSLYPVFVGVWTNWSFGPILGLTLTLSRSNANLLIALVAFWITIITSHIWKIICFLLHFYCSTNSPQDGLHHQRQLLLRNASGPFSGTLDLLRIVWAWRAIAKRPLARILPVICVASLLAVAFVLASGFSSSIATGNHVLVSAPSCALFEQPEGRSEREKYLFEVPVLVNNTLLSAHYAQQCYSNISSGSLGCDTFVHQALPPSKLTLNATCPFSASLCRSQDSTVVIDSGFLDSHEHFGVNSPSDERVQLRLVLSCAPLTSEGRKLTTTGPSDQLFTKYYYGSSSRGNESGFTYEFANNANANHAFINHNASIIPDTVQVRDYAIAFVYASYTNGALDKASSFSPIPELQRPNSDILVIGLSASNIVFIDNTTDPWYRGTEPLDVMQSAYKQDEPGPALGCAVQYQVCYGGLPKSKQCTHLSSLNDTLFLMHQMLENDQEASDRFSWMYQSAISAGFDLRTTLSVLGTEALTARSSLINGIQGPLLEDQWKLDVQLWYSVQMSMMQRAFVVTATGPANPDLVQLGYYRRPNTTVEKTLCRSQKIISTAFVSFSVLGLILLTVLGGIIAAVCISLVPLAKVIQKMFNIKPYHLLEWSVNSPYQLHRLANEELCIGTWTRAKEEIPVTDTDQNLALLDTSDADHPRLQRPPKKTDDDEDLSTTNYCPLAQNRVCGTEYAPIAYV